MQRYELDAWLAADGPEVARTEELTNVEHRHQR